MAVYPSARAAFGSISEISGNTRTLQTSCVYFIFSLSSFQFVFFITLIVIRRRGGVEGGRLRGLGKAAWGGLLWGGRELGQGWGGGSRSQVFVYGGCVIIARLMTFQQCSINIHGRYIYLYAYTFYILIFKSNLLEHFVSHIHYTAYIYLFYYYKANIVLFK